MVNSLMIILGIIGAGALYILGEDYFGGKNKAIIIHRGNLKIVKASKNKDKSEYVFKYKSQKFSVKPGANEFDTGKITTTIWEFKNNLMLPLTKKEKVLEIEDQLTQKRLIDSLKKTLAKINNSWWDENKDHIVGLAAIVGGVFVYVISVKYAGDISPENVNACLQVAADIKNSTLTTENNINNLANIVKNQIPN